MVVRLTFNQPAHPLIPNKQYRRSSDEKERLKKYKEALMMLTPIIDDVSVKLPKSVSNFLFSGFRYYVYRTGTRS
jgi:hypothetical protein